MIKTVQTWENNETPHLGSNVWDVLLSLSHQLCPAALTVVLPIRNVRRQGAAEIAQRAKCLLRKGEVLSLNLQCPLKMPCETTHICDHSAGEWRPGVVWPAIESKEWAPGSVKDVPASQNMIECNVNLQSLPLYARMYTHTHTQRRIEENRYFYFPAYSAKINCYLHCWSTSDKTTSNACSFDLCLSSL